MISICIVDDGIPVNKLEWVEDGKMVDSNILKLLSQLDDRVWERSYI